MKSIKIVEITSNKAACDGEIASSSHPLVYLNIGEKGEVICPYCSTKFIVKKHKKN